MSQPTRLPITVLLTTRNEAANIGRTLESVVDLVERVHVIDSESSDGTVEIARSLGAEVHELPYEHGKIIPWIFQWGLDNLPIPTEWVLILEADQAVTPELAEELRRLFDGREIGPDGFYIRRQQIFRGRWIRWGGYGNKHLMKLFRKAKGSLDPDEQDTRVYVRGPVARLRGPLAERNLKEERILFYLEKHLRYADAFAHEEADRRERLAGGGDLGWKTRPRLFGTSDERVLLQKSLFYRAPLYLRSFGYFFYRYFLRLGFLDGKEGFVFHFLQAFWFRLVVDIRLEEVLAERRAGAGGRDGGGR